MNKIPFIFILSTGLLYSCGRSQRNTTYSTVSSGILLGSAVSGFENETGIDGGLVTFRILDNPSDGQIEKDSDNVIVEKETSQGLFRANFSERLCNFIRDASDLNALEAIVEINGNSLKSLIPMKPLKNACQKSQLNLYMNISPISDAVANYMYYAGKDEINSFEINNFDKALIGVKKFFDTIGIDTSGLSKSYVDYMETAVANSLTHKIGNIESLSKQINFKMKSIDSTLSAYDVKNVILDGLNGFIDGVSDYPELMAASYEIKFKRHYSLFHLKYLSANLQLFANDECKLIGIEQIPDSKVLANVLKINFYIGIEDIKNGNQFFNLYKDSGCNDEIPFVLKNGKKTIAVTFDKNGAMIEPAHYIFIKFNSKPLRTAFKMSYTFELNLDSKNNQFFDVIVPHKPLTVMTEIN